MPIVSLFVYHFQIMRRNRSLGWTFFWLDYTTTMAISNIFINCDTYLIVRVAFSCAIHLGITNHDDDYDPPTTSSSFFF